MSSSRNQNKIFLIGFALIFAVAAWSLTKPSIMRLFQNDGSSEEEMNAEILKAPQIVSQDLLEKMKSGEKIIFVDLRSAGEFQKSHIVTSVNIPAAEIGSENFGLLGENKISDIVLLNSGEDVLETARTVNKLKESGFPNVKYLQGGISAWLAEGFPLVSGGESEIDQGKIKLMDVQSLAADSSIGPETFEFVDVRTADEFKSGHIPNAINIPLGEIELRKNEISSVKKVFVYENREEMANKAAIALFDLNFFNVYVLSGGLDVWKAAGGEIAKN